MRAIVLGFLAGTALASPALAEAIPAPGQHDYRMRTVAYDQGNVTVLICSPGRSTSVEFSPGETVQAIAAGNDKAWVIMPADNRVFVTPNQLPATDGPAIVAASMSPGMTLKNSNMQVVTKRQDGSTRLYQFDLVASPDTSKVFSGVRFVYPDDDRAARAAEWAERRAEAQERVAKDRLATSAFYGTRNLKYVARGSHELEPSEVSDNGRVVTMRFPGNQKVPSIYAGACGKDESLATGNAQDDFITVQPPSEMYCLRSGDKVLEMKDLGWNPYGYTPETGTNSPDVVRTIKRPIRRTAWKPK